MNISSQSTKHKYNNQQLLNILERLIILNIWNRPSICNILNKLGVEAPYNMMTGEEKFRTLKQKQNLKLSHRISTDNFQAKHQYSQFVYTCGSSFDQAVSAGSQVKKMYPSTTNNQYAYSEEAPPECSIMTDKLWPMRDKQ